MKQMYSLHSENKKILTIVKLGASKLSFTVPSYWSISKLKCLLTSEIPSLNFDQFQLCFKEQLLRGNHKLHQIAKNNHTQQKIQVQIVRTKSQIKLKEYYKKNMQNFMKLCSYNNQPLLSVDYQKYKNMIAPEAQPNQNNNNQANNLNIDEIDQQIIQQNPVHPLLSALKLLGIYLILVLIYDYGKLHQIALILLVVLIYFAVQQYFKYKQRKMKKNRQQTHINLQNITTNTSTNFEQQKQQIYEKEFNPRKGLIKLYTYKSIQIIYCFFLTFFPNLTIDMHLQINKERIQTAKKEINKFLPNTYIENAREIRNNG